MGSPRKAIVSDVSFNFISIVIKNVLGFLRICLRLLCCPEQSPCWQMSVCPRSVFLWTERCRKPLSHVGWWCHARALHPPCSFLADVRRGVLKASTKGSSVSAVKRHKYLNCHVCFINNECVGDYDRYFSFLSIFCFDWPNLLCWPWCFSPIGSSLIYLCLHV